jgi:hypothetical protein
MVAPPKKERAIRDREKIVKFCFDYIRDHGPPPNVLEFITWLRSKGILTVMRNQRNESGRSLTRRLPDRTGAPQGRAVVVSVSTVRAILRDVLFLRSRPGRKSAAKSQTKSKG